MTISNCYYNSSILNLIDFNIEMGVNSFDDMSVSDKDELTVYCIDALGDDAYSCIIEENLAKTISQLKRFIFSRNRDDSHELATVMNENAQDYFKEPMNALFEERLRKSEVNFRFEHRYFQHLDRTTGETEWRKSA